MLETEYTAEETALWELLTEHQDREFHTSKGLAFTYEIRGGEMFIDRREKSVTRATVNVAYQRAVELGDALKGPKMLNVFGASYLYPVFVALGVVPPPPLRKQKRERERRRKHVTRIIFVRHGESTGNLDERFYGHFDGELTEKGRRQASLAAAYLRDAHIDAAYASDLRRAYETGSIIAAPHGLTPTPDAALREVYAGEWENLPFRELPERFTEDFAVWMQDIGNSRPTGGESVRELSARVIAAVWRIAAENEGKTVLIASHATPIRALQCEWAGQPVEAMKDIRYVKNASVSIVDYDCAAHVTSPVMIGEAGFLGALATELPTNV